MREDTRALREADDDREEVASAADLREGQRVRVDYTGHEVAESRVRQTIARTIVILQASFSSPSPDA